jgi:hypothetical protein
MEGHQRRIISRGTLIGMSPDNVLEVLPNFLSLEKLGLSIVSISSRELTSILRSLPQITTFIISIDYEDTTCYCEDTPMSGLNAIQLKLRKLTFSAISCSELNNTMANIIQHSPDLVSLGFRGAAIEKELPMKIGNGIRCLSLTVNGKLPPISARGLNCLTLLVQGHLNHEPFEQYPCNLSYLTHLHIHFVFLKEKKELIDDFP